MKLTPILLGALLLALGGSPTLGARTRRQVAPPGGSPSAAAAGRHLASPGASQEEREVAWLRARGPPAAPPPAARAAAPPVVDAARAPPINATELLRVSLHHEEERKVAQHAARPGPLSAAPHASPPHAPPANATELPLASFHHEADHRLLHHHVALIGKAEHERHYHEALVDRGAPEPSEGGMYLRSVSVTVRCVIFMTTVSMVVYTSLSAARNVDELSGEQEPSLVTQTLNIASRSIALAPMICMLFVGCRMYVLATTQQLGEPQDWVKSCMYMVCGGLALQLLVVFLLPAATAHAKPRDEERAPAGDESPSSQQSAREAPTEPSDDEEEEAHPPLQEVTGEQNDAHPVLRKARYRDGSTALRPGLSVLQVVSMGCIYIGVAGVIVGIFTYPAQTTQISAAVLCTIYLSIAYFTAFLFLWVARLLPDADDGAQHMLVNAGLAACSSMRKAPMLAVLCLGARMRALNLDPPHGMPAFWLQCCFYAGTALLVLEALLAAIVGLTGVPKKAYYGVNIYHSRLRVVQIVAHACALLTYALIVAIAVGVYIMRDMRPKIGGEPNPEFERRGTLSTTLFCLLIYVGAYFGVMAGQTLTLLTQDIKGVELSHTLDTFVSAGISLGLAPTFCILFVATRMRALQITQQMGAPPGWAQDCMYICVFATCLQATCCLVMPIFIGGACKVDEDGNPDYDLKPMVGAYAVTVMKYVAMFSLYGGLLMISVAIFVMDEKSCMGWRENRMINSYAELFEALLIVVILFFVALLFSSAKVIGMGVKMAIEAADQAFLGVDIEIQSAALNLCKGYIKVEKLKVCQPVYETLWAKDAEGRMTGTKAEPPVELQWEEDYIFKVKTLLIKINLWRLAASLGKEFELENLTLTGIKVNLEKPNADLRQSNSNVEYVINYIDSLGLIPPQDTSAPPAKPEPKPKPKEEVGKKRSWKEDPLGLKALREQLQEVPSVVLHKIEVGDIGATVLIRNVALLGGRDFHFSPSVGIVKFDNIQENVFGGREDLTPQETIACVIKAIGKSLFVSIGSDLPHMLAQKAKEGAGQMLKRAATGLHGLSRLSARRTSKDDEMASARSRSGSPSPRVPTSGLPCCRRRQAAPDTPSWGAGGPPTPQ